MDKNTTEKYPDKEKETEALDKLPVSHLIKPNTNQLNPDNNEESPASIFPDNNNTESTTSIFPFNKKDSMKSLFPTNNEHSSESTFPFDKNTNSLDSIFASDNKNSSRSAFPFNKNTNSSALEAIFSSNNSSASTFPFSSEIPDDVDLAGLHRLKTNRDKNVLLNKKKYPEQQCDTVDGNCKEDEEENEEIIAIRDFCDEILWEIIREIVEEESDE